MKVFIALLAIVAVAVADQAADVAEVKKYVDCVVKAMTDGVPAVPVPKHNPTKITDQVLKNDDGTIQYEAGIKNAFLYNLMEFEFPVMNATRVNPDRVVYNYEIYWPKLNISGDVKLFWKAPLIKVNQSTSFNIVLNKVRWSGIFDYSKPTATAHGKVNAFSINSKTKSVDVDLKFFGALPIEKTISLAIYEVFNHFPTLITEGFRNKRFNDFWLGNPKHVNAVMDVCGLPHIPEN